MNEGKKLGAAAKREMGESGERKQKRGEDEDDGDGSTQRRCDGRRRGSYGSSGPD